MPQRSACALEVQEFYLMPSSKDERIGTTPPFEQFQFFNGKEAQEKPRQHF